MKLTRDPAVWLSLIATAVRIAVALGLDLSDGQQAVVNAFATAIAGVLVAFLVVRDKQLPAVSGLVQAGIALLIGFGLHINPDLQAGIMSLVGLAAAFFIRTQVVAPVSAEGLKQG